VAPGGEGLAFAFDGPLPQSVTWTGTLSGTVSYDYDARFQVASVAVNGEAVGYSYDQDGLLTQAGSLALSRDPVTGLLAGTSQGAVDTAVSYSAFGELAAETVTAGGSVLYAVTYTRDGLGRITAKTETVGGVTTEIGYEYDTAGRLSQETRDGRVTGAWTYDANGNRTSANGTLSTYDARDRLVSSGSTSFSYTDDGRLATRTDAAGTTHYAYDILGNLHQVTQPDGTTIGYIVDGLNRRIGKTIDGTLTQGFLYEDQLRPIAELDGQGSLVSRFVYGSRINVPDFMIRDGITYRIVADQVGSVRLVIDTSTGAVVQALTYDAWGNVETDSNPGFQPFGFAGGLQDQDTGLVRFGARDYSPEEGRWTTRDGRGLSGGLNQYAYVDSDPINMIDPSGRFGLVGFGVGAVIGAATNAVSVYMAGGSASDVAKAAVIGGIVGGVMGATGGVVGGAAGKLGQWVANGAIAGGLTAGGTTAALGGSARDIATATAVGAATGAAAGAAGHRAAVSSGRDILRSGSSVNDAIERGDLGGSLTESLAGLYTGLGLDALWPDAGEDVSPEAEDDLVPDSADKVGPDC